MTGSPAPRNPRPPPAPITALTSSDKLVEVSASKPDKTLSTTAITGLAPGETLVGIDRRPADGALYGVITAPMAQAEVARIDADGVLRDVKPLFVLVGAAPGTPNGELVLLSGSAFGVDFNPTVDRLRLVSDAGPEPPYHRRDHRDRAARHRHRLRVVRRGGRHGDTTP